MRCALQLTMTAKTFDCAAAATASIAIHRMEMKQIVDSALSPDALKEDCNI